MNKLKPFIAAFSLVYLVAGCSESNSVPPTDAMVVGPVDAGPPSLPQFPSYPGEGEACERTFDCREEGRLVCVEDICVKADRLDPSLVTYDYEDQLNLRFGPAFQLVDTLYGDREEGAEPVSSFANYLYFEDTMEIVVGGGSDDYSLNNDCVFGILGNTAAKYRIEKFACSAFARGPDGSLIVGGLSRAAETPGVPGFVIFDPEGQITHRHLMGPEAWSAEMARHPELSGLARPEVSLGPPTSIIWHDGEWVAVLGLGESWSEPTLARWTYVTPENQQIEISFVPSTPTEHTMLRVEPDGSTPSAVEEFALVEAVEPAVVWLEGRPTLIAPEFEAEPQEGSFQYWSGPLYLVDIETQERSLLREWSPLAGVLVQPTSHNTSVITWMALDSPCGFAHVMVDGELLPGSYMVSSSEIRPEEYPNLTACSSRERLGFISNYVGNETGHLGTYLPSLGWVVVPKGYNRGFVEPGQLSSDGITGTNVWGPLDWRPQSPPPMAALQRYGVTLEFVAAGSLREIPIRYPMESILEGGR